MSAFKVGKYCYYQNERRLEFAGKSTILRGQSAKLLDLFLQNQGTLISYAQISETLWENRIGDFENGIRVAISALRESLGEKNGGDQFIQTETNVGYRFIAPVEKLEGNENGSGLSRPNFIGLNVLKSRKNKALAAVTLTVLAAGLFVILNFYFSEDAANFFWEPEIHEGTMELSALNQIEDLSEKRQGLDTLIRKFPDFAPAYYEKARVLLHYGTIEESKGALTLIDKAISLTPEVAAYYDLKAKALWMVERDFEKSRESFQQALKLDPQAIETRILLAWGFLQAKQNSQALLELEKARRIDPIGVSRRPDVFWIYLFSGNPEQAEKSCRELSINADEPLRGLRCYIDLNLATGGEETAISYMVDYLEQSDGTGQLSMNDLTNQKIIKHLYWQKFLDARPPTDYRGSPAPVLRAIALFNLGNLEAAQRELAEANENGNYYSPLAEFFPGLKEKVMAF